MNVLSLFDGMSCGQIALERAGIKVDNYFASEIDKQAMSVAKALCPNTKFIGSVLDVSASKLPEIDLLVGGSPCQSFSRSGDGTGFKGKSGLFWEYVRVLREVQETNPNVKFLLENVVMKKEWENIITTALGVSPIEIDSKHFSAQKRRRLYWTNIKVLDIPSYEVVARDIIDTQDSFVELPGDFLWNFEGEWRVRNATKKGYAVVNNYNTINLDFPTSTTRRGRVGVDKFHTLNTGCNQGIFIGGKVKKLTVVECARLQTLRENEIQTLICSKLSEHQMKKILGNGWTIDVIAHIFKGLLDDRN